MEQAPGWFRHLQAVGRGVCRSGLRPVVDGPAANSASRLPALPFHGPLCTCQGFYFWPRVCSSLNASGGECERVSGVAVTHLASILRLCRGRGRSQVPGQGLGRRVRREAQAGPGSEVRGCSSGWRGRQSSRKRRALGFAAPACLLVDAWGVLTQQTLPLRFSGACGLWAAAAPVPAGHAVCHRADSTTAPVPSGSGP